MKNYQFDVELDLSLESDVEVRVTNDKYEANVIQYAARAHSVNNRIVLDFTASIRVLDPEFADLAIRKNRRLRKLFRHHRISN